MKTKMLQKIFLASVCLLMIVYACKKRIDVLYSGADIESFTVSGVTVTQAATTQGHIGDTRGENGKDANHPIPITVTLPLGTPGSETAITVSQAIAFSKTSQKATIVEATNDKISFTFDTPQALTVVSQDKSITKHYRVTISKQAAQYSGTDIKSFKVSGITVTQVPAPHGQIGDASGKDGSNAQNAILITLKLPTSTPGNKIGITVSQAITFSKLSQRATIVEATNDKISFTFGTPQALTVISQDRKTTKHYQVTISKENVFYNGASIETFTVSSVAVTQTNAPHGQIGGVSGKDGSSIQNAIPITIKLPTSTPGNKIEITVSQAIIFSNTSKQATITEAVGGKISFTFGTSQALTVTSQDGKTTKHYKVTISKENVLYSGADIESFTVSGVTVTQTATSNSKGQIGGPQRKDGSSPQNAIPITLELPSNTPGKSIEITVSQAIAFSKTSQKATIVEATNDKISFTFDTSKALTVTSQDGKTTKYYEVTISKEASSYSGADIETFTVSGVTVTQVAATQGQIGGGNEDGSSPQKAIPITLKLPQGTSGDEIEITVSQAIAFSKTSQKATISEAKNDKISFTFGSPKALTVASQDKSTTKHYRVTISKSSQKGNQAAKPGTPTGLTISKIYAIGATLTWTKPTNTGKKAGGVAAAMAGYRLWLATNENFTPASVTTKNINGDVQTYLITGLKPNTKYWARLQAKNDNGELTRQYGQESVVLSFTTTTPTYDLFTHPSLKDIYADGLTADQLTDVPAYAMKALVKVTPKGNTQLEVSNFTPMNLEKVEIWATITGFTQPIHLFDISKFKGYSTATIDYPFINRASFFLDQSGAVVDLSRFQGVGITPPVQVTFDYSGSTPTMKKLIALKKLDWTMKYRQNLEGKVLWITAEQYKTEMTPKIIRLYGGYMINLGYLFVYNSEIFRQRFMAELITVDNPNHVDLIGTGLPMSLEEKRKNLEKYYKLKFQIGIANGIYAGGAAGLNSSVFGVSIGRLTGAPKSDKRLHPTSGGRLAEILGYLSSPGALGTAIHEMGHMLGYSHSSNMTTQMAPVEAQPLLNIGATGIAARLGQAIGSEGFPVTKDNYYRKNDLIGYHPALN